MIFDEIEVQNKTKIVSSETKQQRGRVYMFKNKINGKVYSVCSQKKKVWNYHKAKKWKIQATIQKKTSRHIRFRGGSRGGN